MQAAVENINVVIVHFKNSILQRYFSKDQDLPLFTLLKFYIGLNEILYDQVFIRKKLIPVLNEWNLKITEII